ncbi:MAG: HutD family protein [Bdellovibrio sp.]|nr:HutD family protein [Bdellovibrio sp.]
MGKISILRSKDYCRLPWKNGQGYTDQIAISPDGSHFGAGDFSWRLSTAAVTSPGPFSLFPEHRRFLAIIEGRGIEIFHGEEKKFLPAFMAYQFSGASDTRCELPFGQVVDLNFFWRPEQVKVHFEIVTLQQGEDFLWASKGPAGFLFVAEGKLQVADHVGQRLDTLSLRGESRLEIQPLTPTVRAISILLSGVNS